MHDAPKSVIMLFCCYIIFIQQAMSHIIIQKIIEFDPVYKTFSLSRY
jgi:hypothetical protein